MKNSTLFILLIISLFFFACSDKKQEKYNIEILNAALKDKAKQHDLRIRRFWVIMSRGAAGTVFDNYYATYQKAISVQKLRNEVLKNILKKDLDKGLCEKYEIFLKKMPILSNEFLTEEGRNYLKNINAQLKLHQQNINKSVIEKMSWLFTCLELESYSDLMISNNGVGGGSSFGTDFYFIFYDSILNVEEEKKIMFLSPLSEKKKGYIRPDTLVFQVNGSEEQIPYKWENLNGLGFLRFTPPKVGSYEIKGSFLITFQDTLGWYRWKKYFDINFKAK